MKKLLKEVKANKSKAVINKVVFVFLLSLLVSSLVFVFVVGVEQYVYRSDFVSFVNGAQIIAKGEGERLYNLELQRENQLIVTAPHNQMVLLPYRNPPVLALLFVPFVFFHLTIAYKIFTFVLIITTLVFMGVSAKLFENLKTSYWLMLPFLFYPSIVAIFAGQISMFILLIYLFTYFFLKKEKALSLGVITGLLFFKPQYILSFPFIYILSKNRASFIKGLAISSLLIFGGSILISGLGFAGDYFRMLIQTERMIGEAKTSMFTIFYTLSQTTLQRYYIFLINLLMYLIAVFYFYRNHKKFNLDINYCLAVLLTLVFCVHGVIVDMAIVLLPILILLNKNKSNKETSAVNVFVLLILVLSPLGYILKVPYIISFLFLISVALLYRSYSKTSRFWS